MFRPVYVLLDRISAATNDEEKEISEDRTSNLRGLNSEIRLSPSLGSGNAVFD